MLALIIDFCCKSKVSNIIYFNRLARTVLRNAFLDLPLRSKNVLAIANYFVYIVPVKGQTLLQTDQSRTGRNGMRGLNNGKK
jgi:hypothetical protein